MSGGKTISLGNTRALTKDLDDAYSQLNLYREALGNPPLLVVCDMDRFEVHTNFNNTVKGVYKFSTADIPLDEPADGTQLTPVQVLRALFEDPQRLHPGQTQTKLTEDAADLLRKLADEMRTWNALSKNPIEDRQIAHFLMRAVPHFDGGLFDDASVPSLIGDQVAMFEQLNELNWSDIEPSIFGTLFERIIDESKRKQLGTHYTSREDIELIVEPVLMRPLRAAWDATKAKAQPYVDWRKAQDSDQDFFRDQLKRILTGFQDQLARIRVLDPACGSGNFLYVDLVPKVHPRQLFGIEINAYANELASAVVWIGYLQWKYRNSFDLTSEDPILQPLQNIFLSDAIVDLAGIDGVIEPDWPPVDIIVGNPPFLGSKKLRQELGDEYVDAMFEVWNGRVPREADLCCYWFEKARAEIESGRCKLAGLLATQGIRGGKNREVLERISDSGSMFWAQSDRDWILEGATVHVSMVGFDDGSENWRELDGLDVKEIHTNLRSGETDVTKARRLKENIGIVFMGDTKGGPFDISSSVAEQMLAQPNPDGRSNLDVVRRWINGLDITRRTRGMWIIDFPPGTPLEEAALYESPFEYVRKELKPIRATSKTTVSQWWLHERPRPEMRAALSKVSRYVVTPRVAKHRLFVWVAPGTLPDSAVIAFAREDDYYFGVLHSRIHEVWARAQGTQLREVQSGFRYTPTSTFETFPPSRNHHRTRKAQSLMLRQIYTHSARVG